MLHFTKLDIIGNRDALVLGSNNRDGKICTIAQVYLLVRADDLLDSN